ncbi:DDB1- and CUL4-associated factor 13 [Nymphon striatum]|nr:DDB1- and CUL4-associated factor 13 [Nymphon striatum]
MPSTPLRVKVLSRNPDDYLRETKKDIHKVQRNYNADLHPFEVAREYTRALNAIKLERVFAKPFVGSLDGHQDGVNILKKHPKSISTLLSGSCDGEIKQWNLAERKCKRTIQAHTGIIRGLAFNPSGSQFYSVSDDKVIKVWKSECPAWGEEEEPISTIISKHMITGIDYSWKQPHYITCGEKVQLWDENRSEPLRTYSWGVDSHNCIRFNPVETDLVASCSTDRSILLFDTRESSPLRKVVLNLISNSMCWNPMEAFTFVVANEDYNLYSFDMRKLSTPVNIHKDHVSAVIDVDYSPTGKELVSGSYDKTIRIFETGKGHSRDVYHTKRMQRLTSVTWSLDNKYILSGSDEMNIRIWKAQASDKIGTLMPRQKSAMNYNNKLKERFAHHPQVKRIARHRHVPKHIYNAKRELQSINESQKKKEANRRKHSKPGSVPYQSERTKHAKEEV